METENEVKKQKNKTRTGVSPPFFHLVRSSVSPFRSVLVQHVHFQQQPARSLRRERELEESGPLFHILS